MNRLTTRLLAGAGGVLTALALALAPSVAAGAHDYLVQTSPANGGTQTDPLTEVKLTFNDRVLDLGGDGSSAILRVTDASGRHYETGCPAILDTTVTAPVALGVTGAYTVDWQVVSADGHTVSGSYGFEYRPPVGTAAAPGSAEPGCAKSGTTTPGAAAPAPTSTASTSTPTKASSGGDNLGLVIGIAIGIVALALAGVVILLVTARRRPRPTEEPARDTPSDDS
jgi:methionine-rich copper-binding protein CopC